jgi:transcriptional regulator with XRE-family HTH domain
MLVGSQLRRIRRTHDLPQWSLAARAKMSRSYLAMLEAGHRRLLPTHVPALAHALGLSEAELVLMLQGATGKAS